MQIEAGKFYKTRNGRKVGPMERASGLTEWPWRADGWTDYCRDDGSTGLRSWTQEMPDDLIEEWTEPTATPAPAGPVRMVRQIVPGFYGRVRVFAPSPKQGFVTLALTSQTGFADEGQYLTADELRSAAMVFSQLAEALDGQP